MEVLSALTNAVVLLLLTSYILYEAYQRFLNPPEILGAPMLGVALVGLGVNLIGMKLLSAGSSESLNVKGAYFEVLSDARVARRHYRCGDRHGHRLAAG
jgi:cobalt-zinc-cadmium efflux system protein